MLPHFRRQANSATNTNPLAPATPINSGTNNHDCPDRPEKQRYAKRPVNDHGGATPEPKRALLKSVSTTELQAEPLPRIFAPQFEALAGNRLQPPYQPLFQTNASNDDAQISSSSASSNDENASNDDDRSSSSSATLDNDNMSVRTDVDDEHAPFRLGR